MRLFDVRFFLLFDEKVALCKNVKLNELRFGIQAIHIALWWGRDWCHTALRVNNVRQYSMLRIFIFFLMKRRITSHSDRGLYNHFLFKLTSCCRTDEVWRIICNRRRRGVVLTLTLFIRRTIADFFFAFIPPFFLFLFCFTFFPFHFLIRFAFVFFVPFLTTLIFISALFILLVAEHWCCLFSLKRKRPQQMCIYIFAQLSMGSNRCLHAFA